jgi:hypothetical protein
MLGLPTLSRELLGYVAGGPWEPLTAHLYSLVNFLDTQLVVSCRLAETYIFCQVSPTQADYGTVDEKTVFPEIMGIYQKSLFGTSGGAQVVESLPSKHEASVFKPQYHQQII